MHIYNINLLAQGQWYNQAIPSGVSAIVVRPRGNNAIDVGVVGQGTYFTIEAGEPPLSLQGRVRREPFTLRVRCPGAAGEVAEIAVTT